MHKSVCLVYDNNKNWILDTGATNHMVYDVHMLDRSSVIANVNPKKVYLLNGDILLVTHI